MKKLLVGTLAAVTLLLAGLGIAQASIPAPDGTINGCYKNSTGDLRVIDSTASCPSGYTALDWSQVGPAGPTGATGPAGVSGYEVRTAFSPVPEGDPGRVSANFVICPVGKRAVGGGGGAVGASGSPATRDDVVLQSSTPYDFDANGTFRAWRIQTYRIGDTTEAYTTRVFAICATV